MRERERGTPSSGPLKSAIYLVHCCSLRHFGEPPPGGEAVAERQRFLILAILVCTFVVVQVRHQRMKERYAALWLIIGAIIIVLGAFPNLPQRWRTSWAWPCR